MLKKIMEFLTLRWLWAAARSHPPFGLQHQAHRLVSEGHHQHSEAPHKGFSRRGQ